MQSKSAMKRNTSKAAESPAAVPAELNAAPAQTKRAPRASKPKSDATEPSSAKRHRTPNAVGPMSFESAAYKESVAISEDEIRVLAYHFWMERGRPHGSHHEDWFRAEAALSASR